MTPEKGIGYLNTLGFSHIEKDDYGMAACLGGLTVGVSPLEMAKGYATIFNDGYMRDPGCILKITDTAGNIIYEANQEEVQVYQENAARTMTDMLQSVIAVGTAKDIDLGDMPCAGKTGTTNSNRDGWFVGYTQYYTTSVWVGYDIPKQVPGLTGSSYPAAIWQEYMLDIHEGLLPAEFLRPVEYIGTEEQQEEPVLEEEENPEDQQVEGEFDQENPEEENTDTVTYQLVTQTFDGTEIPPGAIPDNATDIQITTTTEGQ